MFNLGISDLLDYRQDLKRYAMSKQPIAEIFLRHVRLIGPGSVLILVALLSACSKPPSPTMPVTRTVQVIEAQAIGSGKYRYSGRLQASERSDLSFETDGFITAINVKLGDSIREGDELATLDDTALKLELDVQKANLKNAQADLRDARLDFERRAALAGTGATSQSVIDQAKARFERAKAQVDSLAAQVGRAEQRLTDTKLLAPFAGEIVARLVEDSEVVTAGQPVLQVIGDRNRLEAVTHVPGLAVRGMKLGQAVTVYLPSNGVASNGVVSEIGYQSNNSGLFPITISLQSSRPGLHPGESIEVHWSRAIDGRNVVIPLTAFVPSGKGSGLVFVVEEDRESTKVASREVTLGSIRSDHIEVLFGLEPGEIIVAKGVDLLEHGDTVQTSGIGLARYNR